jgi:hypothetical protein
MFNQTLLLAQLRAQVQSNSFIQPKKSPQRPFSAFIDRKLFK